MPKGIYNRTSEHKKRISLGAIKGIRRGTFKPPVPGSNKGKIFSKKWIENMSESHKGKRHSLKQRIKIGIKLRGSNSHLWRGGITKINKKVRESIYYKRWRDKVFKRDGYTCLLCDRRGKLNVDHYPKTLASIMSTNKILSLAAAVRCKELWDVKNGRTLCIDCHKKTDTYMVRLS